MKDFSFIFHFLLLLPSCIIAQTKTEYILYLKNGSIIKCSLINYDPAKSITIQAFDGQKFDFKIEEMDSLVLTPKVIQKQRTVQSPTRSDGRSHYSEVGISIGGFIPFGSFAGGASRIGIVVAGRLGNGMNPGISIAFGYCNNGSSNSRTGRNIFYADLGPRFGRLDPVSGRGFSFAPLIGVVLGSSLTLGGGMAVDIHVQRNILLSIQCLGSETSLVEFTVSFVTR